MTSARFDYLDNRTVQAWKERCVLERRARSALARHATPLFRGHGPYVLRPSSLTPDEGNDNPCSPDAIYRQRLLPQQGATPNPGAVSIGLPPYRAGIRGLYGKERRVHQFPALRHGEAALSPFRSPSSIRSQILADAIHVAQSPGTLSVSGSPAELHSSRSSVGYKTSPPLSEEDATTNKSIPPTPTSRLRPNSSCSAPSSVTSKHSLLPLRAATGKQGNSNLPSSSQVVPPSASVSISASPSPSISAAGSAASFARLQRLKELELRHQEEVKQSQSLLQQVSEIKSLLLQQD